MRRGYTDTTRKRSRREDNEAFDYSQDEFPQQVRYRTSSQSRPDDTSPLPRRSSSSNKERPSGIPRPGSNASRLPSALKTPRNRSYSSSSSADSQITNEGTIPPVPQIAVERERSGKNKPSNQELVARSENAHVSQTGLSRRPTSVSRSRSRSHARSGTNIAESHPPPLPGSNSDGDDSLELHLTQESERTPNPKRSSWAKDRRRFADPTVSGRNTSEASRYDQPPTPVISGRKASLKTPTNYRSSAAPGTNAPLVPNRILPATSKPAWAPVEERNSSDYDESSQANSRSGSAGSPRIQHDAFPNDASQRDTPRSRRTGEPVRIDFTKPSQFGTESIHAPPTTPSWSRSNYYSSSHSKIEPSDVGDREGSELVRISSMMDAPLPTPPLPQFDTTLRSRTPQAGHAAVSSPVETLLMGSAPAGATPSSRSVSASTPNSKPISSPGRSARESSVYASTTPKARRLSEPSPSKEDHNSVAGDQEAPPTIFQRLVRRASLSTGKSPKPGSTPKSPKAVSTPKNQIVAEHNAAEPPFGLELETPRPGASHPISGTRSDQPERHKNRQSSIYLPKATFSEPKNPRLKAVEDESAKLGSPFMGDGSPRFGIDERFRSPKKRTKSGLRHDTFGEPNEDRPQGRYDYYAANEVENTGDYLTEALPIATVLSSPDNTKAEKTPTGQSKRRSQYQSTTRARVGASVTNESEITSSVSETSTDRCFQTPARCRAPSSVPPPTITRAPVQSSTDSSKRSQFSDSSDEPEAPTESRSTSRARSHDRDGREHKSPEVPTLRRPRSTVRFAAHHENEEFNRKIDRGLCQLPNSPEPQLKDTARKSFQDKVNTSGYRTGPNPDMPPVNQVAKRASQLPVPRQRKTNSALFRALEQPYESSASIIASADSSFGLAQTSSDGGIDSDWVSTSDLVEGLHAVSSNLSSLNGESVGDIRWSTGENGNKGFDKTIRALLDGVGRSEAPNGDAQCSAVDSSVYEVGEESTFSDEPSTSGPHRTSSRWPNDRNIPRRISIQDKRKAIHEPCHASFEEAQLATNDPTEVRRHQIVRDFCESEANFVDTLQALVQLFVQPLRAENQREWIAGLPPNIMRLFDWLDDITNLHGQLLAALESSQQSYSSISRFCETIRGFIPLMELYQPYVVRVDEVGKMIASMALDSGSDFGEFVRIQSEQLECEESLEDMLEQPMLRLRGYVTTFKELLEVTPSSHADYLVAFSLFHSMHATICVLEEVKLREEEYNLVKNLLNRIRGLPYGPKLATRDRRLLAQGLLSQVPVDPNEQLGTGYPIIPGHSSIFDRTKIRTRSGSESTTYSSTGSAYSSYSMSSHGLQHSELSPRGETNLYALVFTDCLVLARPTKDTLDPYHSARKPPQNQPDTLESIGAFWLLGITDCGSHYGYDQILSLDIISIDEDAHDGIRSPIFVAVSYSNKSPKNGLQDARRAYQEWSQSLHHCYLNTLRSLAFISQSKAPILNLQRLVSLRPVADSPANNTRFPKSPSQQLEHEIERKGARLSPMDNAEEEREERMFWSDQFRVVSEEMQRTYEGPRRPTAITPPKSKATGTTNNGRFQSSSTYI